MEHKDFQNFLVGTDNVDTVLDPSEGQSCDHQFTSMLACLEARSWWVPDIVLASLGHLESVTSRAWAIMPRNCAWNSDVSVYVRVSITHTGLHAPLCTYTHKYVCNSTKLAFTCRWMPKSVKKLSGVSLNLKYFGADCFLSQLHHLLHDESQLQENDT